MTEDQTVCGTTAECAFEATTRQVQRNPRQCPRDTSDAITSGGCNPDVDYEIWRAMNFVFFDLGGYVLSRFSSLCYPIILLP